MFKNNLKKIIKTVTGMCCVLFLIFMTGCSGCTNYDYSGEHTDLYTVAINSLLWNMGHSSTADRFCNSKIEILEKDEYGRALYTYFENHHVSCAPYYSALIVSQCSVDDYVYYYEDLNYLVKEQSKLSQQLQDFSQDEIDELKAANDWGKVLSIDKCTKKELIQNKKDIPAEIHKIQENVLSHFSIDNKKYVHLYYLTCDLNGNYLIYGFADIDNANLHFVAFVNKENSIADWLVPKNSYCYQEELKNFKSRNGWSNIISNK